MNCIGCCPRKNIVTSVVAHEVQHASIGVLQCIYALQYRILKISDTLDMAFNLLGSLILRIHIWYFPSKQ